MLATVNSANRTVYEAYMLCQSSVRYPCEKVDDEEEKLRHVDAALAAPRGAAHGGGSCVAGSQ